MSTNAFEKHGIEHLSASSLNLARHSLALWTIRYLKDVKGRSNMPMYAGIAVENAVSCGLFNPNMPVSECVHIAVDGFKRKTALGGFDPDQRQAKLEEIAGREPEGRKKGFDGMVANALNVLRDYGMPDRPEDGKRQHKVEVYLDGIPVPVIGYKDFVFDHHGLDIDLKTTARMPSDMSADHQLQGAVYWQASGNRSQRFCYVTKADCKTLELTPEAAREAIKTATGIAHCLQRFLSLSDDPDELANLTIPDYSTFRWDDITIGAAREIWGF
jgi:hypothetical protein